MWQGDDRQTAPSGFALPSISQGFNSLPHKNPTNEPLRSSFCSLKKKKKKIKSP